jgi:1A family penicillin-binding protein
MNMSRKHRRKNIRHQPVKSRTQPTFHFKKSSAADRHHWLPKKLINYFPAVLISAIILFAYFYVFRDLPSPTKLGNYDIPISTKIYDRNQVLLYDIYAEQNRTTVKLEEMPSSVRQATIAIEDKNFYRHRGISFFGGMLRALFATITEQQLQGGSTITQQLVKSALLTNERSIQRKIKEIILATWVEMIYSKDKILEMYLNQVPYGGTAWGIEAASEKYFGKNVKELTLAEAALLAGLPQAPTLYSPTGAHPELALGRQKQVLERMVEDGYISIKEKEAAANEKLKFIKETNIRAPHFVMYVKEQLAEMYGERLVERGGLKVYTTLDIQLQEQTQATLSSEIATLSNYRVSNGAALITKPATGEILAMVGSSDYFATPSGSFNVTTALRQPGSSIKPINYAIGIEKRIVTPATVFLDIPTCFSVTNQPNYCPKNYDGNFHGPVQLRFALGNSYNIPAVKMLAMNTVSDMVASASAFGLKSLKNPSNYGLSLTLGGGEVRMVDMATAFSVFANGGIRKNLISVTKVVDKNGETIFETEDPNLGKEIPSQLLLTGERVISRETAYLISHILLDNNARSGAFGANSALVIPGKAVSVKTGTTDDHRDNWTVGYTPQFLVITWVGNNDNTPMNPALVSGVTGAAPIWNKLMSRLLKDQPDIWPKQPEDIIGAKVCSVSGQLPAPNGETCNARYEYFIKDTVPTQTETLKQAILIDKTTGELASPTQTENVEPQEKLVIKDNYSTYCLDCPHNDAKTVLVSPNRN